MAQRARLPVRRTDILNAFLHIDLVETERGDERLGQIGPHMLAELAHGWNVRQGGGIAEQVVERDERVRLAAAVGELQLAHGLVAFAFEPNGNVLHQLAQSVGGIGEREELGGIFVDGAFAPGEGDFVEIRGELGEGELAGFELGLEADEVVPRLHGAKRIRVCGTVLYCATSC